MPGKVSVKVEKAHYSVDEIITISISNGLSTAIFLSPYRTNCTPVTLEAEHTSGWVLQNPCLKAQGAPITQLKSGAVTSYQLTPSFQAPRATKQASWQAGNYRTSIAYLIEPDPDTVQGGILVYSENFSLS